jgi:hypothetical protein
MDFILLIKFLLSFLDRVDERERVVDRVEELKNFFLHSNLVSEEDDWLTDFEDMSHENGNPRGRLQFVEKEIEDLSSCAVINPKFITSADACLHQIMKYLYVILRRGYTVGDFLDERDGILYDYLDLLIRRYLELLLAEGPIVLYEHSEESFEDSKGCAYMLLELMQNSTFFEDDDDSRSRIEKSLSSLLRHTYDSLLQKFPGAVCILYCAQFNEHKIADCSHDDQFYEDFTGEQTILSVHNTIFFQSPDFLRWFPHYLGLERVLFLLEILLKRVREQDPPYTPEQKKMVFLNICTFLIKHFPQCRAIVKMNHLLSIQETERIYQILKSLGLTMPRD